MSESDTYDPTPHCSVGIADDWCNVRHEPKLELRTEFEVLGVIAGPVTQERVPAVETSVRVVLHGRELRQVVLTSVRVQDAGSEVDRAVQDVQGPGLCVPDV